ncbi:3-oxoacyl-ACP synthase [Amycolatopsis rhabdoformis]|uniref:3-oxoacyl-ACP synthase n=1 Tax=Amycolatopsis rhabdoformis TaxID=1448059 RepID=A0ABZ1I7N2_9PSEU|nr:3-oxoacyl-ACP synthase [Amycolatopsis rhabdoformis]WSE29665.1 3-oxoacyl-ACP synthase [Amycolatopsis rhabdoformis]
MRIREPVAIAAAEVWLPTGISVAAEAVEAGRLRARQAADLGHESVPAAEEAPPDLAVAAALAAAKEANADPATFAVVAHAWMYYQGHDLWSPAHYVARKTGAVDALPVGVQQVCNGGAAAIELTVARLLADSPGRLGLVTTGDRFAGPGFDRWAADYGVAYGDAGTAVLLRTQPDPADRLLLRSIATVAAPELEEMHRGTDPFAPAARAHVDMRATKRAYLREHGSENFARTNENRIRAVTEAALRDAGFGPYEKNLRYAVLPRFGAKTLAESWLPVLHASVGAEPLDLGRTTGHLGAGDAAAGLAEVRELLAPGELALVFSAGAGFTWSCLVVQAV